MNAAFARQNYQIDRLLNLQEVIHLTALSRATVYRAIANGDFPPPVKIGRVCRWPASDIGSFVAGLSAKRDATDALSSSSAVNGDQH